MSNPPLSSLCLCGHRYSVHVLHGDESGWTADHCNGSKHLPCACSKLDPFIPGRYRHFKGGLYDVTDLGFDAETLLVTVEYRNVGDKTKWFRKASEFFDYLERDGVTHKRFTYLGPSE